MTQEIERQKKVLEIVADLIADKQKRSVPEIDIESMSEDEADRILKIVEEEIEAKKAGILLTH